MNQSEFGRLAGCGRAYISRLLKEGRLVRDSAGGLDPGNPANAAFLQAHLILDDAPDVTEAEEPPSDPPPTDAQAEAISAAIAQAASSGADGLAATLGLTEEELRTVSRRALYEAQKIQIEMELRAVKLDQLLGAVVSREFVTDTIGRFGNELRMATLDLVPVLAADVCRDLGKMGFESIAHEIIRAEIEPRLEAVIKNVQAYCESERAILNKLEEETE